MLPPSGGAANDAKHSLLHVLGLFDIAAQAESRGEHQASFSTLSCAIATAEALLPSLPPAHSAALCRRVAVARDRREDLRAALVSHQHSHRVAALRNREAAMAAAAVVDGYAFAPSERLDVPSTVTIISFPPPRQYNASVPNFFPAPTAARTTTPQHNATAVPVVTPFANDDDEAEVGAAESVTSPAGGGLSTTLPLAASTQPPVTPVRLAQQELADAERKVAQDARANALGSLSPSPARADSAFPNPSSAAVFSRLSTSLSNHEECPAPTGAAVHATANVTTPPTHAADRGGMTADEGHTPPPGLTSNPTLAPGDLDINTPLRPDTNPEREVTSFSDERTPQKQMSHSGEAYRTGSVDACATAAAAPLAPLAPTHSSTTNAASASASGAVSRSVSEPKGTPIKVGGGSMESDASFIVHPLSHSRSGQTSNSASFAGAPPPPAAPTTNGAAGAPAAGSRSTPTKTSQQTAQQQPKESGHGRGAGAASPPPSTSEREPAALSSSTTTAPVFGPQTLAQVQAAFVPASPYQRVFWLLRQIGNSMTDEAWLSPTLHVSREVWAHEGGGTVLTRLGAKVRLMSAICDALGTIKVVELNLMDFARSEAVFGNVSVGLGGGHAGIGGGHGSIGGTKATRHVDPAHARTVSSTSASNSSSMNASPSSSLGLSQSPQHVLHDPQLKVILHHLDTLLSSLDDATKTYMEEVGATTATAAVTSDSANASPSTTPLNSANVSGALDDDDDRYAGFGGGTSPRSSKDKSKEKEKDKAPEKAGGIAGRLVRSLIQKGKGAVGGSKWKEGREHTLGAYVAWGISLTTSVEHLRTWATHCDAVTVHMQNELFAASGINADGSAVSPSAAPAPAPSPAVGGTAGISSSMGPSASSSQQSQQSAAAAPRSAMSGDATVSALAVLTASQAVQQRLQKVSKRLGDGPARFLLRDMWLLVDRKVSHETKRFGDIVAHQAM